MGVDEVLQQLLKCFYNTLFWRKNSTFSVQNGVSTVLFFITAGLFKIFDMAGVEGVLQQGVGVSVAMFSTPCFGIKTVFFEFKTTSQQCCDF